MFARMIARDFTRNRSVTVLLVVLMMLSVVLATDHHAARRPPALTSESGCIEARRWLRPCQQDGLPNFGPMPDLPDAGRPGPTAWPQSEQGRAKRLGRAPGGSGCSKQPSQRGEGHQEHEPDGSGDRPPGLMAAGVRHERGDHDR